VGAITIHPLVPQGVRILRFAKVGERVEYPANLIPNMLHIIQATTSKGRSCRLTRYYALKYPFKLGDIRIPREMRLPQ
jgi:hypothetical protein